MTPITSALEAELREKIQKTHLVVWLDVAGDYTAFVDDLLRRHREGDFPYPVVAFRGSFLEVMLALAPHGAGDEKPQLLVHVPGHNKTTIRKTPLLEVYEAGKFFEKALDTLIREVATGLVPPEEIERFLASRESSLAGAEGWLAAQTAAGSEGFARTLEAIELPHLVAQLVGGRGAPDARPDEGEMATLRAHLLRQVGLDEAWIQAILGGRGARNRDELGLALGAWLLCTEYVHDLARAPYMQELTRLRGLSRQLVERCGELSRTLREHHAELYERLADEVQALLPEERDAIAPEDLGKIDTFRFEEAKVLEGTLAALEREQWDQALAFAAAREGERSFWLGRDPMRRHAWSIVTEAARLGKAMAAAPAPLQGARSLADAVERYARAGAPVDRAHRGFEQTWQRLWDPRVPHLEALKEIRRRMQRLYRGWADTLARDFTVTCVQHGFLPEASLQQRTLFEQVVMPLCAGSEKVAYFVVDAFRYEMAADLVEEMQGPGTVVELRPRLAELPTITAVGMNVLAPVATGGRLSPALETGDFKGFRTGEFTVREPEDRARAMAERSGAHVITLKLAEICEAEAGALRRKIGPAKLILVHSQEIDEAGEVGLGIRTFEGTLRDLKAALHHLLAAGVKQFVLTADHGFLLQDETTREHAYGTKRDPDRRHVLADEPRREAGAAYVALDALGYEKAPGYLIFREDTTVYATGRSGAAFVHGGNSPEERIIPVLTVRRRSEAGAGTSTYTVEVKAERDLAGMRCLRLRVLMSSQLSLGFAAAREIELGLRVPGRPEVQLTIKDVRNPGALKNGRVVAKVGEEWTDVYFSLEGPGDDKVQLEVHHPLGVEQVAPCTLETLFAVDGRAGGTPAAPAPASGKAAAAGWLASLPDEATRRVFLHLEAHGAVTEEELCAMLGSPRAARRFAADFDELAQRVPFRARVEQAGSGKRYVKEQER